MGGLPCQGDIADFVLGGGGAASESELDEGEEAAFKT